MPGIGPTETQRFGMHADQAADLAVADALLGHLSIMEATVDGITADLDTEFLHDFRVAVRRTRSVLKLLGDVLPDGTAATDGGRVPLARRRHHADAGPRRLSARLRRARRVRQPAATTCNRSPITSVGGARRHNGPWPEPCGRPDS